MRLKKNLALVLCGLLGLAWQVGCQTAEDPATAAGIQDGYRAYVAAKVAVLKCQVWPSVARLPNQPLVNISEAKVQELCGELDQFIISSFRDQPFMKGISPGVVSKLMERAKRGPDWRVQLDNQWPQPNENCLTCNRSTLGYVQGQLAQSTAFRIKLNDLSRDLLFADAVLLPYLEYAYEQSIDDAGFEVNRKRIRVLLLLMDTNNGGLIWAGARDSGIDSVVKSEQPEGEKAPWSAVLRRLFTEDLWREYPGRQLH